MANSNKCGMTERQWADRRAMMRAGSKPLPTDPALQLIFDSVSSGEMTQEQGVEALRDYMANRK